MPSAFALRIAVRQLLRARAFSLAVIVTLALVFSIDVIAFGMLWHAYLRPLPYRQADRLVALFSTDAADSARPVSLPDLLDVERSSRSVTTIAGYLGRTANARTSPAGAGADTTANASSQVITIAHTTGRLFDVLGVMPEAGRWLTASDEQDQQPVAVISHALAVASFGSAARALGATLELNEEPYTIVGVARADFEQVIDGAVAQAFTPISYRDYLPNRGARSLTVVGRLADGASLDTASAEMRQIGGDLARAYPDSNRQAGLIVKSLIDVRRGDVRRPLLALLIGSLTVTLLAFANVFNIALARALRSRHEARTKIALGASRGRLALDALLESAALVSIALAAGVLLRTLVSPLIASALGVRTDVQSGATGTIAFTAVALIALATCALAALAAPAVAPMLRDAARGAAAPARTTRSFYAQHTAVVIQLTLSTGLLVVTGILVTSFWGLTAIDPGFRTERLARFGIGLPEVRYDTDEKLARFHTSLLASIAGTPQVTCAGAAFRLPLAGRVSPSSFAFVPAPDADASRKPAVVMNMASPDFFRCLSIPLAAGRFFDARDVLGAPRVVIVNEAFRQRFGGGADGANGSNGAGANIIGRRIALPWRSEANPRGSVWEIVGVVNDTQQLRLDARAEPEVFLPLAQFPAEGASYVVALRTPDRAVFDDIRRQVTRIDPDLQQISIASADLILANATAAPRRVVTIAGALTLLAVALATIGVVGAALVQARHARRSTAIRLALGGSVADAVSASLRPLLLCAAAGSAIGLLAGDAIGQAIRAATLGLPPVEATSSYLLAIATAAAALLVGAIPHLLTARSVRVTELLKTE